MKYPIYTALLCALLSVSSAWSEPVKSSRPIHVITNDWTSQIVLAHIVGELFIKQGYQVEYSSLSTAEQWGAMALGLDHVQVEVWEGTMSDMFGRMVASGRLLDAGTHKATTREDWWYPEFVEALCPGLPDWRALKKCSALFADETKKGVNAGSTVGRYIAGPWEKPEAARIRALEMNFKAVPVTSADELWEALAEAVENEKPVVLFNWTPNWVEARYQGKFVEFPAYDPECETNPSWGVNPEFHYDCGNPASGWLKKAAWQGMASEWPCAYETLRNVSFDNQAIAQLAARVDVDKYSHKEAALEWLAKNEAVWLPWMPDDCRPSVSSLL